MHDRVLKTLTANSQRQSVRGRGAAPDTQSTRPIDRQVGQQLRILRIHSSLSQAEIGQKVSLSHQQIEQFESGKNRMGASVLYEVTTCLNVPIARFFEALPEAELASSYDCLSEIDEYFADLPTSKGRGLVEKILRLHRSSEPAPLPRSSLRLAMTTIRRGSETLAARKHLIDSEEANHERELHRD